MPRPAVGDWLRWPWRARGRRPAAGGKRRAWRPVVEALEDRRLLSTLQAISLPPPGTPPSDTAAGDSTLPAVSADGRFVAYVSTADNLVPGQSGTGGTNVFLFDRATATTTLVSHLPGSATAAGDAATNGGPFLSADGRYVAYATNDAAVVGQPAGPGEVVVVYDRLTGQNLLVSHASESPTTPVSVESLLGFSGSGRYVVFDSFQGDLVPGEGLGFQSNVYEYDLVTGATQLVSHTAGQGNASANNGSYAASVADDGTVAFLSYATDLVAAGQTGSSPNVFLYDPATGENQLVSAVSGSFPGVGAGNCSPPVLSGDGSAVAYASSASDLVAGQASSFVQNVYLYDRAAGTTRLVSGSRGSPSTGGNGDSGVVDFGGTSALAVSHDGRFVAFVSQATDLLTLQTGAPGNVFLYDTQAATLTLASGVSGSPTAGAGDPGLFDFSSGPTGPGPAQVLSLSGDGSLLAFVSEANDLVRGQTGPGGTDNVFLYDRAARRTTLVSTAAGSTTSAALGPSAFPVLSADGSLLAFHSRAGNLVGGVGDLNGAADVFTFSPATGAAAVVSRAAFPQLAPGNNYPASVSADGRYTVFLSTAPDLVPNQVNVNGNLNVFLYDRQTGSVSLVNHAPGLPATTGDEGIPVGFFNPQPAPAQLPVLSADGSAVVFTSSDDNLVPGEPPSPGSSPGANVYRYDVATGAVRLVNHADGNDTVPNQEAVQPAVSADGRYVAYVLGFFPPGLFASVNGTIALYDTQTDQTTLVTPQEGGSPGAANEPGISDDGRFVSYLDTSSIHVYDRLTAQSTLVSHEASSSTTPASGFSFSPVISHDGSTIAFVSDAPDLVAGQSATSFPNVFLYRVATGAVSLVSGTSAEPANGFSDSPALSDDGTYVAFRSDATNLVPSQDGPPGNIFEYNSQTGTTTLVSHQAGSPSVGTGGISPAAFGSPTTGSPAIDGDGHLVAYLSPAGDLVPGQGGPAVANAFVWLRQTGANLLASGQGGSATVGADAASDAPLLTRDSLVVFGSPATDLQAGVGGTSVVYQNSLVAVTLAPNTVTLGSPSGTTVGTITVTSLAAGQSLPPVFSLPPGEADNSRFTLGPASNGSVPLVTAFQASAVQTYQVDVHVNAGFGDQVFLLLVSVTSAGQPAPTVTTLTSTADPSPAGAPVTFTIVVGPASGSGTPTGTVTLTDGPAVVGTATLAGGVAAVNTSSLGVGQHTLVATYNGDANFAASSSAPLTHTITATQAPAFTSLAATTFTEGARGSFTVTATGAPVPALTLTGTLPAGVTFQDKGDGTATLSGTPAAGSARTYTVTLTAHNGVGVDATQTFVLTVTAASGQAPSFTSPARTTFVAGSLGNFTVTATGAAPLTLSESPGDKPPDGVSFDPATGLLSGTPAPGSGGTYTLNFTARNGAGPDATQTFTLVVNAPSTFQSANGFTFIAGTPGSFRVTAGGSPLPMLREDPNDKLPGGLTFNPAVGGGGGAVGLLTGTPVAGTGGTYTLHFAASNGVGADAVQVFTLTVAQAPAFRSANGATFTAGSPGAFPVAVTGFPAATLSSSGTLPPGVAFDPASGVLGGTPAPGSSGTYVVTLTASNNVGNPVSQTFTLTVNPPPPITGPLNITGLVSVSPGSPAPVGKRGKSSGTYQQTVTVTNTGPAAIEGPIALVLEDLAPRKKVHKKFVPLVVVSGAGTTRAVAPGSPFLLGPSVLPAGGTATFRLSFRLKGRGAITFNPVLLAGYTQP